MKKLIILAALLSSSCNQLELVVIEYRDGKCEYNFTDRTGVDYRVHRDTCDKYDVGFRIPAKKFEEL